MSVIPAAGVLLKLYQGSTHDVLMTFTVNGVVKNLTGYTAALQVRKDFNPASPVLLSLATITPVVEPPTTSGLVMGGVAGTIRRYITDELLAAVSLESFRQFCEDGELIGLGVWDLEMTNPDGETSRYVMGSVEFSPEVTR